MERTKISPSQLVLLALGSALMLPYTFMSVLNNAPNNQDVWLVGLLSLVYFVIFNAPIVYIVNKYKGMSFEEIFTTLTGKPAAKVIAMLYAVLLMFSFVVYMLIIVQFIGSQLMTEVPIWILLLITALPPLYAAAKGGGVVAKLSLFIVPLVLISILVFALFSIKKCQPLNIMPILLESSFLSLNKGAFMLAGNSSEIVIFLVFSGYIDKRNSRVKSYSAYILSSVIFMALIILPTIMVLGFRFASVSLNPYYNFIRQVQFYKTIERVQALNVLINFPGILLRLSVYLSMTTMLLHSIFNKINEGRFALLISIIGFITALIFYKHKNLIIAFYANSMVYIAILLSLTFVLPIACLVYDKLKKNTAAKADALKNGNKE